jgi:hypothetical protein
LRICFSIREDPLLLPEGVECHPTFETWQNADGEEYGFGFEEGTGYWMRFHHLGSYIACPTSSQIVGHPDPGVSREWFEEFFFHFVVPLLLQRQDWDCLHASAVATPRGAVALCGPSGRGKSTLARVWCEQGVAPHADDSVPFAIRDGRVVSARLPQRPRLRGEAALRFPAPPAAEPARSIPAEVILDVETALRPLASVYWLEPMSHASELSKPRVERIPALEAFRLLLGEAQCISLRDPECNRKMVRNYLRLVQLAPVFRLFFRAGLERIPGVLDCVEENERRCLTIRL